MSNRYLPDPMNIDYRPNLSLGWRLFILAALFFMTLIIVGFIQLGINALSLSPRTSILLGNTAQNILVFIFPALCLAYIVSKRPIDYLRADRGISYRWLFAIPILYIASAPFISQLALWNADFHFPESMAGFEKSLREMEETAAKLTNVLLDDSSVTGLVTGILVVGILTGIGEETFFRAGIQRALTACNVNRHVAIWTTAIIFSAVHFQFYGFLPRIVIGAILGYLYYYSGSLWVPAAAHAFNNSLVVIDKWMTSRGISSIDMGNYDMVRDALPWMAIVSLLLTMALARYYFRKPEIEWRRRQ